MNCKELEQKLVADPQRLNDAERAHVANCSNCTTLHDEMLQFDQTLQQTAAIDVPAGLAEQIIARQLAEEELDVALRESVAVKVPEGLADRIIARQQTAAGVTPSIVRRSTWYSAYAMAASIILAFGVFLGVNLGHQEGDQIGSRVVQHMRMEPRALNVSHTVEQQRVNELFSQVGIRLNGTLQNVQFADNCALKKAPGVHLVLQSENGPVTVMIVPDVQLTEREIVKEGNFRGVVIPTQRGAMAIVGEHGESVERIERQMMSSTEWI
jgi:hypothetical protein